MYTTYYAIEFTSMAETYRSVFPSEAALQTCSVATPPLPAIAALTARFLTSTVVSYVGSSSSSSAATTQETVLSSNPAAATTSIASPVLTSALQTMTSPSSTLTPQNVTSASQGTGVTEGSSGSTTTVNTVETASPRNSAPGTSPSAVLRTWLAGFVVLILLHLMNSDALWENLLE